MKQNKESDRTFIEKRLRDYSKNKSPVFTKSEMWTLAKEWMPNGLMNDKETMDRRAAFVIGMMVSQGGKEVIIETKGKGIIQQMEEAEFVDSDELDLSKLNEICRTALDNKYTNVIYPESDYDKRETPNENN